MNLLAYGTLGRPAEERGISLWGAKQASRPVSPPVPTANPVLAGAASESGEELQRQVPAPTPAVPPAAIRSLTGAATEPAVAVGNSPKPKGFGADKGDYYPTELRAKDADGAHGSPRATSSPPSA